MNQNDLLMQPGQPEAPLPEEFFTCTKQLVREWKQLEQQYDVAVRSYFLFERWRDNNLASIFLDAYPKQAAMRVAVPDELYEDEPDDAPCIVAVDREILPADAGNTMRDYLAYEWLGRFLQQAWLAVQHRRSLQGFCGILFTSVEAEVLARHLRQVGYQYAPDGQARLLRYQDPRVIQRVWPVLNEEQRQVWMGPVFSWLSLNMPWGPGDHSGEPTWFTARPSLPTCLNNPFQNISRSKLLNSSQWLAAHSVPAANTLWQRYEEQGIPSSQQPTGSQMDRMLNAASSLGISVTQLERFLSCVWHPCLMPQAGKSSWFTSHEGTDKNSMKHCKFVARLIQEHPDAGYKQLLLQINMAYQKGGLS